MRGIDISVHNHSRYSDKGGVIPWDKLRAAGVDFVIIRTGGGLSIADDTFQQDVLDAQSVGMQVGAYHYSYALNASAAMQEAEFCKRLVDKAGSFLELPVFFDMEDGDGYKDRHFFGFNRRNVTNICKAWLKAIQPLNSGVYASLSWFDDYIDWKGLVDEFQVPIWSAQYNTRDDFQGYMWQFTDSLRIDGKLWDGNILYDSVHQPGLNPFQQFVES